MQCDRLRLIVGLSFVPLSRWLTADDRCIVMILLLCVTICVILVVWFLLPRVARLMSHTPTAISSFAGLRRVQRMAVCLSVRCTVSGHLLHAALTRVLVRGHAIAAAAISPHTRLLNGTVG